jgi:hypothetical protein
MAISSLGPKLEPLADKVNNGADYAAEGRSTIRATDWAVHFYEDPLHVENCEFRNRPIRFWLVSFVPSNDNEKVYAVVLPDGKNCRTTYIDAKLKGIATKPCVADTEEQLEKKS